MKVRSSGLQRTSRHSLYILAFLLPGHHTKFITSIIGRSFTMIPHGIVKSGSSLRYENCSSTRTRSQSTGTCGRARQRREYAGSARVELQDRERSAGHERCGRKDNGEVQSWQCVVSAVLSDVAQPRGPRRPLRLDRGYERHTVH